MELLNLWINMKMYKKIYDTRYKLNYDEYQREVAPDIVIPFDVIAAITKHVDMDHQKNINYYNELLNKMAQLNHKNIEFKVYKDNYGAFRKIILKTDKILMVKNLYY